MSRLNWDDLRLFIAVARQGRFVAAGRALGMDQSSIARRITQLEDSIGAQLMDRSPKGVILTEAGIALMGYAERIEAEFLNVSSALGERDKTVSGVTRLATPEAFGIYLAAPYAFHLHQKYPDLRLELTPESQRVQLANRDADLAVMLNRPPQGPIIARKLVDYRIGLYASRRYLDEQGDICDAASLPHHPFASYIDERIDIPELRYLREVSEDAASIFRSTSIAAQHEAVAGGLGVGMLHVFAAEKDPRLVRILPDQVEITRTYWLAIHEGVQRLPRVRAVVDFLDELVQQHRGDF